MNAQSAVFETRELLCAFLSGGSVASVIAICPAGGGESGWVLFYVGA